MTTIFLLLLLVGLKNGHPTSATCAVTHDSEGWHYKIVGENKPPCPRYDWTRGTTHVLANYMESVSNNEVQQWDDTYLHLRVCAEDIQRNRDCPREDSVQVIKCQVNCTEIFPIPSSTGRRHVSLIPVVLLFLLLLLLLACWSRCCKPKNQQKGTGPSVRGLGSCCYTRDQSRLTYVAAMSAGETFPRTCTLQESRQGHGKSSWIPHTPPITFSSYSPQAGATDPCAPNPADT